MYLDVAAWTERNHELQDRLPGNAVVNNDGSSPVPRHIADAAAVTVPLQNQLSQASEVFLILTPEGVTGRAKAMREDPCPPAPRMHRHLCASLHFPAPGEISIHVFTRIPSGYNVVAYCA